MSTIRVQGSIYDGGKTLHSRDTKGNIATQQKIVTVPGMRDRLEERVRGASIQMGNKKLLAGGEIQENYAILQGDLVLCKKATRRAATNAEGYSPVALVGAFNGCANEPHDLRKDYIAVGVALDHDIPGMPLKPAGIAVATNGVVSTPNTGTETLRPQDIVIWDAPNEKNVHRGARLPPTLRALNPMDTKTQLADVSARIQSPSSSGGVQGMPYKKLDDNRFADAAQAQAYAWKYGVLGLIAKSRTYPGDILTTGGMLNPESPEEMQRVDAFLKYLFNDNADIEAEGVTAQQKTAMNESMQLLLGGNQAAWAELRGRIVGTCLNTAKPGYWATINLGDRRGM